MDMLGACSDDSDDDNSEEATTFISHDNKNKGSSQTLPNQVTPTLKLSPEQRQRFESLIKPNSVPWTQRIEDEDPKFSLPHYYDAVASKLGISDVHQTNLETTPVFEPWEYKILELEQKAQIAEAEKQQRN